MPIVTHTHQVSDVVALFPLGYVLLPGMPLPIHVFEPRYRQLLADITLPGGSNAFGVVLGEPESGVARPEIASVGTMAEILENEPYGDGSCDLLTVGSRRFLIEEVDESSAPYLQARVTWLTEDDGDLTPGLVALACGLSEKYGRALAQIGGGQVVERLAEDPVRCSYEIALRLKLSHADRQSLLASATAAERLAAELILLRREIVILEATHTIPVPAQMLHIQPSYS